LLDITLPRGEFDTLGGFIMSEIGRIPQEDEKPIIVYEGFSFTVEEVNERRIERIVAVRLPDEEATEEEK